MNKENNYSAKFFRDNLPDWKKQKDSVLVRHFFRPISFYTSSIATKLGFSANAISFLSVAIALIGSVFFLFGINWTNIVGAITIWLWMLLDCTDGNIARSVAKQPYGEFADASSSYILINLLFTAIGVSVYKTGGLLLEKETWWIVLLGAFAGGSDSLARLLYQKFENTKIMDKVQDFIDDENDVNTQKSSLVRIHDRIDKEFGLNGIFLPLLLLFSILNWLDLYLFLYGVFYILSLVVTYIILVYKIVR